MKETQVSIAELRETFEQDPLTGRIRNRTTGATDCDGGPGYRQIRCFGAARYSHRIAFALAHGRWPKATIDHINGNRKDNRLANLREASRSENQCNRGRQKNNTSGVAGVHYHRASGKWQAYIAKAGRQKHLGLFPTREEAAAARVKEQSRLFGAFSTKNV